MPSSSQKWQISLFSLFLFVVVVSPMTYRLTDQLLGGIIGRIVQPSGCPTTIGFVLHALVFLLLVRYSMDLNLF